MNTAPSVGVLPPASLQTFAKYKRDIPGLVLADHQNAYVNKFYNSIYDNASNVRFLYYENVTQNDSSAIPYDSLQWHIANVSLMVAKSVYEEITGESNFENAKPDIPLVGTITIIIIIT